MVLRRVGLVASALAAAALLSGCLSAAERDLDGIEFEARSGQDGGSALDWIADNPVRWLMSSDTGEYRVRIAPPCGPVQAPVTVTDEQILVDMSRAAIAAVACAEPIASRDAWVHAFIGEPIDYTWDGETLIMTNDGGSLTFQRAEGR